MVTSPTREVIVNFNHLEFTINAKINCILTKFIHFICFEDSSNQVRILSEGSQSREEIAIPKAPLVYIFDFRCAIEYFISLVHKLRCSFPLYFLPFFYSLFI